MWQTIGCEGDMVQIHFFLLPYFLPIMIVPLSWLGWRGAATFVRRSILDISVSMWYLNCCSMGSLHSPRPSYFSYKLCGQPAELCGVLQTFIKQFYLSSFVKKRKLCRDNDWNKLVCWDITDCFCRNYHPVLTRSSNGLIRKHFFPIPSQKCNYE